MRQLLKVFFLFGFFLFFSFALLGQTLEQDSLNNISKKDISAYSKKIKKRKKPKVPKEKLRYKGMRVGFDLYQPVTALLQDKALSLEFNAEILLNRVYFFTLDAGYKQIQRQDKAKTFTYKNNGFYVRMGVQKNYRKEPKLNEVFFLGLHYGLASFQQSIQYQVTSEIWGDFTQDNIKNKGLFAHWIEVSGGLKVEVLPHFFVCPTLRATISLYTTKPDDLIVNEIPGIGLKKTIIRFRPAYQLMYQF